MHIQKKKNIRKIKCKHRTEQLLYYVSTNYFQIIQANLTIFPTIFYLLSITRNTHSHKVAKEYILDNNYGGVRETSLRKKTLIIPEQYTGLSLKSKSKGCSTATNRIYLDPITMAVSGVISLLSLSFLFCDRFPIFPHFFFISQVFSTCFFVFVFGSTFI